MPKPYHLDQMKVREDRHYLPSIRRVRRIVIWGLSTVFFFRDQCFKLSHLKLDVSSPRWLPDFKTGKCLAGSTDYSIPSTKLLIEKIECCRRSFDSKKAQTCMNDLPSPSICKCLDCKEDEVCGGLWKGVGYPIQRSDSLHETKVHIVVSHCKESLEWMTEYTKDFIDSIVSIHIISKCGEPVEGAPDAATVEFLPNVGRW
jgi:hypothetical protein